MADVRPALEALRRYGADLATSAPSLDPEAMLTRAREAPAPSRRRRRVAPALAITTAFLLVNAGLAVAADGAAPGDALYPVDRAYERLAIVVGLGAESPDERLDEAAVVAARGKPKAAVAQTRRALAALDDSPGLPDAILALEEAEAELTVPAPDAETIGVPDTELLAAVEELIATAHEVADTAKAGGDPATAAAKVKEKASQVAEVARSKRPDHAGRDNAPGQDKEPGEPAAGKGPGDDRPGDDRPGGSRRP